MSANRDTQKVSYFNMDTGDVIFLGTALSGHVTVTEMQRDVGPPSDV